MPSTLIRPITSAKLNDVIDFMELFFTKVDVQFELVDNEYLVHRKNKRPIRLYFNELNVNGILKLQLSQRTKTTENHKRIEQFVSHQERQLLKILHRKFSIRAANGTEATLPQGVYFSGADSPFYSFREQVDRRISINVFPTMRSL